MRTNWTLVGGVLILGAAAAAGTAIAASISTVPGASGRGQNVNSGYFVSNVTYTTEANPTTSLAAIVTQTSFRLQRTNTVGYEVLSADTTVFAQLAASTPGNWASCAVGGSGVATCALTGAQRVRIDLVTGVNVVAYDKLGTDL